MKKPWENDSCEHVQSYYTIYPVPVAAALWCGIPPGEIQEHLDASTQVHRAVYRHPYIPCLEPRCRAMHEAIDKGALLVSRENGKSFDGTTDHVAAERRHVTRQNLKEWIAREFPADKPAFLFDEIERKTHAAINADAFRALQVDRDAARAELEKAESDAQKLRADAEATGFQISAMEKQIDALNSKLKAAGAPDDRSETTYLNIIAALLDCIAGNLPNVEKHPSFTSEAKLIEAIDGHFRGYGGLSQSTLSRKFPAAKRSMAAQ